MELNERGFDENGLFHFGSGIVDNTSKVDKYGFDVNGNYIDNGKKKLFNHRFFEYQMINVLTGKPYDLRHFDIDGNYWKKINGEYQNTYQKYDENGLDYYGFDKRGIHSKTGLLWDENLFMSDGYNIATHSRRDAFGFDRDECHKTPKSVDYDSLKTAEEYLDKISEFNTIDKILYTIDYAVAKGIIANKELNERFLNICREIDNRKVKTLIKK